jgi:hypothetical protein
MQCIAVAADLDLEALALRPEVPGGLEVLAAHEPGDRDPHDHLVAHERLPPEALPGHAPRFDLADRGVDGGGRDREVEGRAHLGADERADVHAVLLRGVDVAAHELELVVPQHALDRGSTDARRWPTGGRARPRSLLGRPGVRAKRLLPME